MKLLLPLLILFMSSCSSNFNEDLSYQVSLDEKVSKNCKILNGVRIGDFKKKGWSCKQLETNEYAGRNYYLCCPGGASVNP